MEYQKIIEQLEKKDSTILSFPDRGPWGDPSYQGNCSGWVQAFLIWKYRVQKFAELFSGSGTGYDVAKDMNVSYIGADLNPVPVRPGILSLDAFSDDVPESFSHADFLFMHPPYGAEIHIPYAGFQYPDSTGDLSKKDLGQMEWKTFIQAFNHILMKYYAAMPSGSRLGVLVGDVRRNGHFYSMFQDMVKVGDLEQILVKRQFHVRSAGKTYMNKQFVPIEHEFLLVMKKIGAYLLSFQLPKDYQLDIRDSMDATWRDVVFSVLKKLSKKAKLSEIYREIEGYKKAQLNPHWKEKVRQTLQKYDSFRSVERGIWQLAS